MPVKDPALKKLGLNVRMQREALHFSQELLAEKADFDRTYVGSIERGEKNATVKTLLSLSKALGVTVSQLCAGIDA